MADAATIRPEDVMPVESRVSWGAIFAGAVVALATYLVLTMLGAAVGLSISSNMDADNLGTAAAIWAVASTAIALFFGGWITSQCCVGETKTEAFMHGLIMWGVVFAMLLWLVGSGLSLGFNAMVGMANVREAAAGPMTSEDWQATARRAGVPQEQIDQWSQSAANAPQAARQEVADPAQRQENIQTSSAVAWWTFAGTLLSMAAAIGGALVGAGPNFRIFPLTAAYSHTSFRGPAVGKT